MIHDGKMHRRRYADQVSLQAAQLLVVAFGEPDDRLRAELLGFAQQMTRHARWLGGSGGTP